MAASSSTSMTDEPQSRDIHVVHEIELSMVPPSPLPPPSQTSSHVNSDLSDLSSPGHWLGISDQSLNSSDISIPPGWTQLFNWRPIKYILLVLLLIIIGLCLIPFLHPKIHALSPSYHNYSCDQTFHVGTEYTTISEALDATPSYSPFRLCLLIPPGEYHESIEVGHGKTNLAFIGAGLNNTYIIGSNGSTGPTLTIYGSGFSAIDLTVKNSIGGAMENWGDKSIIFRVRFDSRTSSLFLKGYIQFYRSCLFYGSNDMISGHAITFFQRCEFYVQKSSSRGKIIMIGDLQNRVANSDNSFTLHLCKFGVIGVPAHDTSIFLGSLSEDYARFIVLQSEIDPDITGYVDDQPPVATSYFAIFNNSGPNARDVERLHMLPDRASASKYSLRVFLEKHRLVLENIDIELELL